MHEDPTRLMGQPDDRGPDGHKPHGNMRLRRRLPGRRDRRPGDRRDRDRRQRRQRQLDRLQLRIVTTLPSTTETHRVDDHDRRSRPRRPSRRRPKRRNRRRPRNRRRRPPKRRRRRKKKTAAAASPRPESSIRARLAPRVSALPPQSSPTASYEADPAQVDRVLLLYSGGLDTSVMLKWIQDSYEAEVVCLTVNLGQPGEDYGVIEAKARQLGAVECHVVDARERFAAEFLAPAIKANAVYGNGYPLFTALGRPLIAAARGRVRAQDQLRHDRPRLHRQGQRPGPDRGHGRDPGAGAAHDRPGALLADGPRGGDRLRPRARDPGQGRHRGRALLDRRQPLGPLLRGPLDRGPRPRPRGRRLPARHPARGGARRGRDRHRRLRGRAAGLAQRRAASSCSTRAGSTPA